MVNVCCKHDQFGDYAECAEIGYSLQKYINSKNLAVQCVLSSNVNGVKKFHQLYGQLDSSDLSVHRLPFKCINLEENTSSEFKDNVIAYIEVGSCMPAPLSLIKPFIKDKLKMIFVASPHDAIKPFKIRINEAKRTLKIPASLITLGYGEDRIGIPIPQSVCQPLDHKRYYDLTTNNYGFIYFSGIKKEATEFVHDYIKISIHSKIECRHYVILGPLEKSMESIKDFVIDSKTIARVVHNQTLKILKFNEMNESVEITDEELISSSSPFFNGSTTINFMLIRSVNNEEMRSLVKNSIPFIGITGVNSMVLGIEMQKIFLYQHFSHNHGFIEGYQSAIFEGKFQENPIRDEIKQQEVISSKNLNTYLKLWCWEKKLSEKEIEMMIAAINDQELQKIMSKEHSMLIALSDGIPRLIGEIIEPSSIKMTQHQDSFFNHLEQKSMEPENDKASTPKTSDINLS